MHYLKTPSLLLALSAFFWAGNIVLARAVHNEIPPFTMVFFRWSIALALLLPFVFLEIKANITEIQKKWKGLLWLGFTGTVGFNAMMYIGLNYTTANNAVLINSLVPVFILVFSFVFMSEKIGFVKVIGCGISFIGMLVIITSGQINTLTSFTLNPGDFWISAAMMSWAIYTISLKNRPTSLSPLAFLASLLVLGLPILIPFCLWEIFEKGLMEFTIPNVLSLLYFGVFPSLIAYIFWNYGVSQLGASRAGIFTHLVPVFGILLSAIFLKEKVHAHHILGASLIFVSIWILNLTSKGVDSKPH